MRNLVGRPQGWFRLAVGAVSTLMFGLLTWAVLSIPEDEVGMAPQIAANIDASGVEHPVTAVLLNFRGYDTLLEIGVLVLATIGVMSLRKDQETLWTPLTGAADPVLSTLTRSLVPLMVLVAGYLLWAGEHAPGGAFQAGSVLGAAGVLLALSGYARPSWVTRLALRFAVAIGFIVFLAIGIAPLFLGGQLLQYPAEYAKTLMIVIESLLTFSIGVILVSLFLTSASPANDRIPGGGVC